MAFLDIPAHYVYVGDLPEPKKYLCTHPAEDNYRFDGGAGWYLAMSKPIVMRRRKWIFALGCAAVMPEVFAEWLTTEAAQDFARGYAFVSPAELIGMPRGSLENGIEMAADANESVAFSTQLRSAEVLFNLELPYIDEMDTSTFRKIVEDNDHRLERFRFAIKKLIKNQSSYSLDDVVDELRDEVAQMQLSDSTLRLRQSISKFGGVFTTFGAGISAFGSALGKGLGTTETVAPMMAGAATAGAVAAFVDIWKQCAERRSKQREGRYSILWDLGIKAPGRLKRTKTLSKIKMVRATQPILPRDQADYHWLCDSLSDLRLIFQAKQQDKLPKAPEPQEKGAT